MSPAGVSSADRLAWAGFLAATLHGLLILGVGFSPGDPPPPVDVPTLEVTLLQDPRPDQHEPEDPDYLAQANQQGAGTTRDPGEPEIHDSPPATEIPEQPPQALNLRFAAVTARQSRARADAPQAGEDARPLPPPTPEGGETRVTDEQVSEHFIAVNTRESGFAEYLAAWKARMERIGTANFPAAARRGFSGRPVVEVALAADGRLHEVKIVQPSGDATIDQAAIDIVRLGSPFDPFPAHIRAQYDVLRFAYEWRFLEGQIRGSGVFGPEPQ